MSIYQLYSKFPIVPEIFVAEKDKYELHLVADGVSDGYHTMDELYEHRHALFIALLRVMDSLVTPFSPPYAKCWKSRIHYDDTMYEGFFIAGISIDNVPFTGPIKQQYITYHLPVKYWDHLVTVQTLAKAPPYDNFTSQNVIERLLSLCR